MLNKKLEKVVDFLVNNGVDANVDKDIILYGLTVAVEQTVSIISAIILGWIVGLVWETITFLVSFSLLRTYAGGYHCKTATNCYFMSIGIVFAVLMIVKYTPQGYTAPICILMLLISVPLILKHAPMESIDKPLDENEKEYYRKMIIRNLIIECCIILALLITKIYQFSFVMSLGFMVSALAVILQKQTKNQAS